MNQLKLHQLEGLPERTVDLLKILEFTYPGPDIAPGTDISIIKWDAAQKAVVDSIKKIKLKGEMNSLSIQT